LEKNTYDYLYNNNNHNKEKELDHKADKLKKDFQIIEKLYKDNFELIKFKINYLNEKKKECFNKFNDINDNIIFIIEEVILKFCVYNQEIAKNNIFEYDNIKKVKI
jgi:hypothetical protein